MANDPHPQPPNPRHLPCAVWVEVGVSGVTVVPMIETWHCWSETGAWPDWQDAGRLVEAEFDDGSRFTGRLVVDDFLPDGEGGECPVWFIADGDSLRGFSDCKRFRYLP